MTAPASPMPTTPLVSASGYRSVTKRMPFIDEQYSAMPLRPDQAERAMPIEAAAFKDAMVGAAQLSRAWSGRFPGTLAQDPVYVVTRDDAGQYWASTVGTRLTPRGFARNALFHRDDGGIQVGARAMKPLDDTVVGAARSMGWWDLRPESLSDNGTAYPRIIADLLMP